MALQDQLHKVAGRLGSRELWFSFFPESPISVSLTDKNIIFKFYFCIFLNLGEESLAFDILEQLTHVERFDMVLLFMSAKEKNGMCYSKLPLWFAIWKAVF